MTARLSRRAFVRASGAGLVAALVAPPLLGRATPPPLPDPARITATDPALLTALEAVALLQARRLHPRELLDACLRRSAAFDGPINAWVRTYPDVAGEQAEQAGQRLAAGDAPLLCGLPFALKDMFAVAGLPLTASSRVLAGNIAAGDATAYRRLRDQGMVLLGHAHTDEFALGMTCPQVGNPWDASAVIGGSSGGSAAVVAAGFGPIALGTDTGGSIRVPAARAGVSAIKPTFGQVSNFGVIPATASRDHVGAMGRSLADAALVMSALSGHDPHDPSTATAVAVPSSGYPTAASGDRKPLAGKRFGVDRPTANGLPGALGALMSQFLGVITGLGGQLVDIALPPVPSSPLGDGLEAGLYHRQWSDRLGLYRPESAAALAPALASLAAPIQEYFAFEQQRLRYQHDYNRLLADHALDVIVAPTVTTDRRGRDEVVQNLTEPPLPVTWANYAGAPALSLPAGLSGATGMPFGVQLGGRIWGDAELIAVGLEIQAAEPAWLATPELPPGPRELPHTARSAPGPGPDPTNTIVGRPPAQFVPTAATG
ncbi:amidase [Nocardia sp. NPDC003345]